MNHRPHVQVFSLVLFFLFCTSLFSEEALRIGITPNSPPMIYKSNNKIVGLEADFAVAVGEALGREIKFVEVPWKKQINSLKEGKTDIIMSGMSVTKMRKIRIAFVKPYLIIGQMALIRTADTRKYNTSSVILKNETIGVEKATTGDLYVQHRLPSIGRVAYTSPDKAVRDLKSGAIDLFIHDAPIIWQYAAENEAEGLTLINKPFTQEYLAWGIRKEDRALKASLDAIVVQWNKSGKMNEFLKLWIPFID